MTTRAKGQTIRSRIRDLAWCYSWTPLMHSAAIQERVTMQEHNYSVKCALCKRLDYERGWTVSLLAQFTSSLTAVPSQTNENFLRFPYHPSTIKIYINVYWSLCIETLTGDISVWKLGGSSELKHFPSICMALRSISKCPTALAPSSLCYRPGGFQISGLTAEAQRSSCSHQATASVQSLQLQVPGHFGCYE